MLSSEILSILTDLIDSNSTTDATVPTVEATTLQERIESVTAEAGRVQTIDVTGSSEIDSIRIMSQPSHGHVSVNPDLSLALVLSEEPGNTAATDFRYEIAYANGSTQQVNTQLSLTASQQQAGWGAGNFYMLAENANGKMVVEHGDKHRKVYVTSGDNGLTAAEIAAREGIDASKITADWLVKHPAYGSTPATALSTDLGIALWYKVTGPANGPVSHWLLFERGHDYVNTNRLVYPGANGESELHPIMIGAYGAGKDPVIHDTIKIYQQDSFNVVIQGIDVNNMTTLEGGNVILDSVSMKKGETAIQNMDGFTLRNSDIVNIHLDKPANDATDWSAAHLNRISGAYIANTDGLLIENNLFDHNGWADGYKRDLSGSSQPPSMYSHNLYLQASNLDVTVRDNVLMRGASFGAQVRSGGVIEDNAFIDNNAGLNTLGGVYNGSAPVGNYSLVLDNLVTSASHKRVAVAEGALSMGIDNAARQSSLIGNIVAHLADPNNAAEIAAKPVTHSPLSAGTNTYFNDTIVHNWGTAAAKNTAGLDKAVLNNTTIQHFTSQLTGKATIADLGNYLRNQYDKHLSGGADADAIIDYFRKGFGQDTGHRAAADTLHFAPDDRGDGMRWDNRLNWDSGDLPGTKAGDSVDLNGNRVLFGAQTVAVDDFIFGDYGQLNATSGKLTVTGGISVADTGATLEIDRAGQVWVNSYLDSDRLEIDVAGGRFANDGVFAGQTDLKVSDNGQAILAIEGSSFDLSANSVLTITGTQTRVGFDGATNGNAVLRMDDDAAMSFVSTAQGLGKLAEFRSGALGEVSKVTSGIHLDGDLKIDLTAWEASNSTAATTWTVLDADQIIGNFDNLDISGLASNRNALLTIDYVRDEVRLQVSAEGTGDGSVRITTSGDANFDAYTSSTQMHSLWDSLNADMPAISDNIL